MKEALLGGYIPLEGGRVIPIQKCYGLFTIYKKIPEILVGNFRSVRMVRVIYHLPKISALLHRTRLDSSYNMKLVRNSRNL